ncbi:MAG: hypothetical protein H6644_20830 [Caldilineaceae bacterium]|nr:hypothetical protein [Caldilineaceae bacterium]
MTRVIFAGRAALLPAAAAAVGETADRAGTGARRCNSTSVTLLSALLLGGVLGLQRSTPTRRVQQDTRLARAATAIDAMAARVPPAQVRIARELPSPRFWYYYCGLVAHVLPPAPHVTQTAAPR